MTKPIEDVASLLNDLNQKFGYNLGLALTISEPLASTAEMQARAIPVVAKILADNLKLLNWQRDALCMFDEVFADIICSIYLSACGLDKPAQMILRRALEVGTATVYVWDLPHIFWGWKNHDKDLNFNEMLDHFSSEGYKSMVRNDNDRYLGPEVMDIGLARSLYRKLSNIVHGKMTTFESVLADKFQHNQEDWRAHLELVCSVEDLLFGLWKVRFKCVSERLLEDFPQLRMLGANDQR